MKKLKITVCIFFVLSCIIFGIYFFKTQLTKDSTPPTISFDKETISISVKATEKDLLKGVTALDKEDGNITDSIRISSMSHFISKGKRKITYIVFDKSNNVTTATRELIYTDYISPRIYAKHPFRYTTEEMQKMNKMQGMTAEDCIDGNLTNQIRRVYSGNSYDTFGTEKIALTLQVNNSMGDVCSIPVEISVINDEEQDKYYPLLSEYIVYTKVGKPVSPTTYLKGISYGNMEYSLAEAAKLGVQSNKITVKSNVDYNKPGVYINEYTCKAKSGVETITKQYVVVEE